MTVKGSEPYVKGSGPSVPTPEGRGNGGVGLVFWLLFFGIIGLIVLAVR